MEVDALRMPLFSVGYNRRKYLITNVDYMTPNLGFMTKTISLPRNLDALGEEA